MLSGKRLAKTIANAAHHKLAFDIELLDVKSMCSFASYFLMMSGKNRTHLLAIRESLEEVITAKGAKIFAVEGAPDSGWLIIDGGETIIHIFHPDQRSYYNLFALWGDAESVPLTFSEKPPAAPKPAGKKPKKKKAAKEI